MAVTAKDIAKHLGISAATVSMVFNAKPGISEATRELVMNAAAELGYTKHQRAPAASRFITLVIYKRHGSVVSDTPFFAEVTQGIDAHVRQKGYRLLISYFYKNEENYDEQIRSIASAGSAGIILLATEMHTEDFAPFEGLDIPIVLLDSWFPQKTVDSVVIDNLQGAQAAVQHLIQNGHTEIGHLASKVEIRNFRERREGYLRGLRGIRENNSSLKRLVKVAPEAEQAYRDMLDYLAKNPSVPTAYFADNDVIAIGCIRALRQYGYKVPQEVSVVGFDDAPAGELLEPGLTTMQVNKASLGMLAVERLLSLLCGETLGETTRTAVRTQLVPRGSVWNIGEK